MKDKVITIIKITITFLLLGIVMARVDLKQLLTYRYANVGLLTASLLFSVGTVFFVAIRSSYLVSKKCQFPLSLVESFKIYLYSYFYGMMLPSAIGGDGIRIYFLKSFTGKLEESAATVIVERFGGLSATLCIAFFSSIVLTAKTGDTKIIATVLAFAAVLFMAMLVFFSDIFMSISGQVFERFNLIPLFKRIKSFWEILNLYKNHKKILITVILISIIAQFADITAIYLYSLSVGFKIAFYYFLIFIPLIYIITSAPVTINGIGLREGAAVFLFGMGGVSANQALILAFLIYIDKFVKGITVGLALIATFGLHRPPVRF